MDYAETLSGQIFLCVFLQRSRHIYLLNRVARHIMNFPDILRLVSGRRAVRHLILQNIVEEGEKSTSIYDRESLKEKDKYTVFFGGNHARIDISTTQKARKNLLLFKDSYANCMVQFA